jgi:hypothetical protein
MPKRTAWSVFQAGVAGRGAVKDARASSVRKDLNAASRKEARCNGSATLANPARCPLQILRVERGVDRQPPAGRNDV